MQPIRLMVSMVFLKAKPQDIVYNINTPIAFAAIYVFSGYIVLIGSTDEETAIYSMVLDLIVLTIFVSILLYFFGLSKRLVQTCSALYGTAIIFHILAWPLLLGISQDELSDLAKSSISLLFLMLLSWQVLVNAHIFRHAMSVDTVKAVLLAITHWLLSMLLSQLLISSA